MTTYVYYDTGKPPAVIERQAGSPITTFTIPGHETHFAISFPTNADGGDSGESDTGDSDDSGE